jgi:hypothetical protein
MGLNMHLYKVPRNSFIKLEGGDSVFKFIRLDGLYSYCQSKDGIIHIRATAPVDIVDKPEWWIGDD